MGIRAFILLACLAWAPLLAQVSEAQRLIASLSLVRNERLYYQPTDLPANLTRLIALPGATESIIITVPVAPDPLVRFNLVTALVRRLTTTAPASERSDTLTCLARATSDPHPWVRTEAIWGIGLWGFPHDIVLLAHLLRDEDSSVRLEAERSIARIEQRYGPIPW